MPFKKHDWTSLEFKRQRFNRPVISGEFTIKEGNRVIDKQMWSDNLGYRKVLKLLKSKYGFEPEVELSKEFEKEEIKDIKKDIDFLGKSSEW